MLSRALLLVLVLGLPSLPGRAQGPAAIAAPDLATQLDAWLAPWFDPHQPGAAVLLMQEGKVLFKRGYGLANVKKGVPIDPDMPFEIGSVTKQFTAAAVMKLVEDGKVDLNAPIASYLGSLPNAWKNITVTQLLNHTSGLPNFTSQPAFWAHTGDSFTPSKLLDTFIGALPLDFEPGTKWRYSNSGYILLGELIEKVSGQSYPDFVHKRLLAPLGLTRMRYESTTEPDLVPVLGYCFQNSPQPTPRFSKDVTYSAGGLFANAEDLARWTLALHAGKVVKPESLERMLAWTKLRNGHLINYGFGLGFLGVPPHTLVGHTGHVAGFGCVIEAMPDVKAVAVILHNSWDSREDLVYFARRVLDLVVRDPRPNPIPVILDPARVSRLVGRYQFNRAILGITYASGLLHARWEGSSELPHPLVPFSETKFGFEGEDPWLQVELLGDKVMGLYRLTEGKPDGDLGKRLEPSDPEPRTPG